MDFLGSHGPGGSQIVAMMGAAVVVTQSMARHMPAPLKSQRGKKWPVYAWVFDAIQDLMKNNDRIGEQREDGSEQLKLPI